MGAAGCTCYVNPSQELARQQQKALSSSSTAPAPTEYVPGEGAADLLEPAALCWKSQSHRLAEAPRDSKGGAGSSSCCRACCSFGDTPTHADAPARAVSESKLNMHKRQNSRETNQSLVGALRMVSRLAPMKVVRFEALKAHKKLPRSNDGLAVLYETLDPKTKVIFLSHRWLRPWQTQEECERHDCVWAGEPHPDDEQQTKFALLIYAIEKIVEQKRDLTNTVRGSACAEEWTLHSVAVWLDFACIDQDDVTLRTAGVSSLLGYMSRCDLVVIPTLQKPDHCTVHRMKTRKAKDEEQNQGWDTDNYGVRAWTRLEAMCFYVLSLLRDQENPELYYSAPHGDVGKVDYVLLPYTLPSTGTLTVASDVAVVLGHERTLLNVLHESAIGGCKASQGPAMVAAAASTELKNCAFLEGQKSYLQDLLEHGLDPNTQDNQGLTALWSASWVGCADQNQMLLESRADPNMSASSGLAAIHNAARMGHMEVAKVLLDHRADIELQDKQGNTPLMWAIQHNRPEAATFLLDSGAQTKMSKALQLANKLQYEPFVTMIMDRFSQEEMEESDSGHPASSQTLNKALVRARRVSTALSRHASELEVQVLPSCASVASFRSQASAMPSQRREAHEPVRRDLSQNVTYDVIREMSPNSSLPTQPSAPELKSPPATPDPPTPSPAQRAGFRIGNFFRGGREQADTSSPRT